MKASYEASRPGGFPPGVPDPAEKRTWEPKRRDGRYFKSLGGVNICYDWSRNGNGCWTDRVKRRWLMYVNGAGNPIEPSIVLKFLAGPVKRPKDRAQEKGAERVLARAQACALGTCDKHSSLRSSRLWKRHQSNRLRTG